MEWSSYVLTVASSVISAMIASFFSSRRAVETKVVRLEAQMEAMAASVSEIKETLAELNKVVLNLALKIGRGQP